MKLWPVAIHHSSGRTLIGLPDRLGDGSAYRDVEAPSLEEVAGEDWSSQLLARLLPKDRAWAWWTRTEVFKNSRISSAPAPSQLDPKRLNCVLSRSLLRRMTLCFVPPNQTEEQNVVTHWADQDTEQIPDHILTAPDGAGIWETDSIIRWCSDRNSWSNPSAVGQPPAERVLVMFDGYIFCALNRAAGEAAFEQLRTLAETWGVRVVPGQAQYAWITPPQSESES